MSRQLLNLSDETFHATFGEAYRKRLIDQTIKYPELVAQFDTHIIIVGQLPISKLSVFRDIRNIPWC